MHLHQSQWLWKECWCRAKNGTHWMHMRQRVLLGCPHTVWPPSMKRSRQMRVHQSLSQWMGFWWRAMIGIHRMRYFQSCWGPHTVFPLSIVRVACWLSYDCANPRPWVRDFFLLVCGISHVFCLSSSNPLENVLWHVDNRHYAHFTCHRLIPSIPLLLPFPSQ